MRPRRGSVFGEVLIGDRVGLVVVVAPAGVDRVHDLLLDVGQGVAACGQEAQPPGVAGAGAAPTALVETGLGREEPVWTLR